MELDESSHEYSEKYLFLPATSGPGVLVLHDQIVGARPNGPDQGSVVYTKAGPSIYTALSTRDLANVLGADLVAPQR